MQYQNQYQKLPFDDFFFIFQAVWCLKEADSKNKISSAQDRCGSWLNLQRTIFQIEFKYYLIYGLMTAVTCRVIAFILSPVSTLKDSLSLANVLPRLLITRGQPLKITGTGANDHGVFFLLSVLNMFQPCIVLIRLVNNLL